MTAEHNISSVYDYFRGYFNNFLIPLLVNYLIDIYR
jgi:hypothetical protein